MEPVILGCLLELLRQLVLLDLLTYLSIHPSAVNLPTMAISAASHRSTALQALVVFSVLAVLVADAEGRHHVHHCPPFSCGRLRDVSSPFRDRKSVV